MNQIETTLSQLRLSGMAKAWQALMETHRASELSFAEGLEILLQSEKEERATKRFERLKTNAKFRYQASIEEINFDAARGLNKDLISNLATCEYITKGEAVLITGATGCGKSFLASALGHHACIHGKSVGYYNTQKLLMRAKMAKLDGSMLKFFDKIAKISLLILDDFALRAFSVEEIDILYTIVDNRQGFKSIVMTSNRPPEDWLKVFPDMVVGGAILDRMVSGSYKYLIEEADSYRKNGKNKVFDVDTK